MGAGLHKEFLCHLVQPFRQTPVVASAYHSPFRLRVCRAGASATRGLVIGRLGPLEPPARLAASATRSLILMPGDSPLGLAEPPATYQV